MCKALSFGKYLISTRMLHCSNQSLLHKLLDHVKQVAYEKLLQLGCKLCHTCHIFSNWYFLITTFSILCRNTSFHNNNIKTVLKMYDFETDIILLERNLSFSYTLIEINNIDDYIEKKSNISLRNIFDFTKCLETLSSTQHILLIVETIHSL